MLLSLPFPFPIFLILKLSDKLLSAIYASIIYLFDCSVLTDCIDPVNEFISINGNWECQSRIDILKWNET